MAVITITSDYGLKDHYVAALKGALYRELENPLIVDVTHQIQSFNITEAAFILRNAYIHFPKGSVHLICVDEDGLQDHSHLVMKMNDHIFIAANNGVLSMLNPDVKPDVMVEVDLRNAPEIESARDIFARVAGHLLRGGKPEILGRVVSEYKKASLPNPTVKEDGKFIIGTVIYIDRYGNLVTNITKRLVNEVRKGRQMRLMLIKGRKPINKILGHYYEENEEGKAIAVYNAAGHIEIAIFKSGSDTFGGASDLLGMRVNDHINLEFV